MQTEGAAHRNTRDIAVRCTFMESFNLISTNPSVTGQVFGCAALAALELFFFDVRFKNHVDIVKS